MNEAPPPSGMAPLTPGRLPGLADGFCDPVDLRSISRRGGREITALRTAFSLVHTPEFAAAAPLFDEYLAVRPDDVQVQRRRRLLGTQLDVQAGFHRVRSGAVTLDHPADRLAPAAAQDVAGELAAALDEAARLTGTIPRERLYAVVYRDRSELLAVVCAPAWARGAYDGTLRLALEAGGEVPSRSLRHEALHAQLVPAAPHVPEWFSEGLAQHFEARGRLPWSEGLAAMQRTRTYIPFPSLEASFTELDATQDAALAYVQSHALVHLLVERNTEAVVARAVELLRAGTPGPALLSALDPALTGADLLDLLDRRRPR